MDQSAGTVDFDDDWEEWDGTSPFWVHCVAGSMAGVAEHILVYPLDTVRTHIQVCAACHFNPATHNASTQAATVAAHKHAPGNAGTPSARHLPPGSVLQQAAASATSSSKSSIAQAVCKTKAANLTASPRTGGMHHLGGSGSPGTYNLSILQAIRQLVSQRAAVSQTGSAAAALEATATTTASPPGVPAFAPRDVTRLWRGVQTILVGCIPAHALYFSTYEIVKASTLDKDGNVTAYGSALAGGAAVFGHDLVLGPLDTVKQRLQLGHYNGLTDALTQMIRTEGAVSLLRSFPVTLATNIPYGMIMVGTNEFLKDQWTRIKVANDGGDSDGNSDENYHIDHSELTMGVTLGASSLAGLVAAATTTPLDRIKTYLQTQQLAPKCLLQNNHHSASSPEHCPLNNGSGGSGPSAGSTNPKAPRFKPIVADWRQAALRIYQQEGYAGFFRGVTPRILSHTPAVAISWTTYETFKRYLKQHFVEE
ncbi:unnamed protein product [Pseudo-nitzschia multistriata]|uniref:Mitochondrial carrier protein n=1 Tax=Pseudo-nitzschia multistriata TaxID=183589 RepID=A0A448Z9F7_9STRA|nr:unnamed protein product [Pseudo-nitzschia multistriata]